MPKGAPKKMAKKKKGTSRSRKKSTVSKESYKEMQSNWEKKIKPANTVL
jgi:hypothetical protein